MTIKLKSRVPELCQELQSQLLEQQALVLHKCHQSTVENNFEVQVHTSGISGQPYREVY